MCGSSAERVPQAAEEGSGVGRSRCVTNFAGMKKFLITLIIAVCASLASAQTQHEYASIEFSPAIRKLGIFGTSMPSKVVDLKVVHMDKRELDILTFFQEVQDLEKQGWEVFSNDVVALDKGIHMYVWTLRKPKP